VRGDRHGSLNGDRAHVSRRKPSVTINRMHTSPKGVVAGHAGRANLASRLHEFSPFKENQVCFSNYLSARNRLVLHGGIVKRKTWPILIPEQIQPLPGRRVIYVLLFIDSFSESLLP
jgi:hypothetical protein